MIDIDTSKAKPLARCINPSHDDKNPSMSINKPANKVKCFSCGASMDGIDVTMALGQCDFKTAIKNLNMG